MSEPERIGLILKRVLDDIDESNNEYCEGPRGCEKTSKEKLSPKVCEECIGEYNNLY
jgi:hypothetical protein